MAAGSKNRIAVLRTVVTFMVFPRFDFNFRWGNSRPVLDGQSNPADRLPFAKANRPHLVI
jgi:hypothetical protein